MLTLQLDLQKAKFKIKHKHQNYYRMIVHYCQKMQNIAKHHVRTELYVIRNLNKIPQSYSN